MNRPIAIKEIEAGAKNLSSMTFEAQIPVIVSLRNNSRKK